MNIDNIDYLGIDCIIKRGTAEVLEKGDKVTFVQDTVSDAYFLACEEAEEAIRVLDKFAYRDYELLVVIDSLADIIYDRYGFTGKLDCSQVAYYGEMPILSGVLDTRIATVADIPVISSVYHLISEEELKKVIERKNLVMGYHDGKLVGFIGEHLEGSMGQLYIFPEFRRRGYATELEKILIKKTMEEGLVPFGQVVKDNTESLKLQQKLGLRRSDRTICWMWK